MKFYRRLYGGEHKCAPAPPTLQTSVKFRDFAELTILLILRRSFPCCRQIFPNLLNSWKGLFRIDMQIKFIVDLYSKADFVSNVIKFSFQVIKVAFKRIKIFFRSIKFAFQRIKLSIGADWDYHWVTSLIVTSLIGDLILAFIVLWLYCIKIGAFFGICPLQIYGFTGEFPFGGFLFLFFSVLSFIMSYNGSWFYFWKNVLGVSILVTVLLVTRTTTFQVNTTMCTTNSPFITLHEHLQIIYKV